MYAILTSMEIADSGTIAKKIIQNSVIISFIMVTSSRIRMDVMESVRNYIRMLAEIP